MKKTGKKGVKPFIEIDKMSRRCSLVADKGPMSGNNVSHSNRKTRRRFLPNLQVVSFISEALNQRISLRLTPSTIRTIEHNDGIDSFLVNTSSTKLTEEAVRLKKKIKAALSKKQAA